jgi:uncharacterized protein YjbJ (UPF0337 family)
MLVKSQEIQIMTNRDVLAGQWKQWTGKAREKWGKLTNDELDRTEGRIEQLAGLIQERYGRTKAQAEREVEAFFKECSTTNRDRATGSGGGASD